MQASDIVRSMKLDEVIQAETSGCLAAFAATLERAPATTIETFLQSRPAKDRAHLIGLIGIELRRDWEQGRTRTVENYLERFPDLASNREQVLDLIYAEYCERKMRESEFDSADFYQRFPGFRDSLERLFRIDSLFGVDSVALDQAGDRVLNFPEVGDVFLSFRLVAELGRGAFGRVFLAEQTDLSDRRVVIKITPLRTIEHQTLARMEHPHIVPVHSVHRDELSGLQAVCMPDQCAVAISDVHATWRESGSIPRGGDVFLQGARSLIAAELQKNGERSEFPFGTSYVHACAWIMHKLASALHHAHLRGIYHRDLKPSNILLTASGRPLLVDFNLAFNRQETDGDCRAFFGGTLPYMPPEQIRVLHPDENGRADDVGPRSDIYSLAASIYELLTGQLPFAAPPAGAERLAAFRAQLDLRFGGRPSARARNPAVPHDLDAVLSKCLDPEPHRRYETAGVLADDLERFLQDYPLRHIGVVPARITLLKFARRNRQRLLITGVAAALLAAVAGVVNVAQAKAQRERAARERAEQDAKVKKLEADSERQKRQDTEVDLHVAQSNARIEVDADKKLIETDGKAYFRKGVNYFSRRLYLHAILIFNDAENLGYRSDHYLYYYRARSHARFDEDREALRDYNRAIELNPDFPYSYMSRAIFYATSKELHDYEHALADVQQALAIRPTTDEGASAFLVESARVYARVWSTYPDNGPLSLSRDETLRRAEQQLFDAVAAGFAPESVRQANQSDRWRMLEDLLKRDPVQRYLAKFETADTPLQP